MTVPAIEPVRVWHLLSHTSGLTAGFLRTSVVDALYRRAGYDLGHPEGATLASLCDDLARLPLLFQPGSAWGYGASTDVLGRLIELWSGQPLDVAIAERVTGPLGMADTVWHTEDADRLAALYLPDPVTGRAVRADDIGKRALGPPAVLSAGGGMLSTLPDYVRFTRMLAGGGEVDGVRVLAPRTLRLMTTNHLSADLGALSTGGFTTTSFDGIGFGLGLRGGRGPGEVPQRLQPRRVLLGRRRRHGVLGGPDRRPHRRLPDPTAQRHRLPAGDVGSPPDPRPPPPARLQRTRLTPIRATND